MAAPITALAQRSTSTSGSRGIRPCISLVFLAILGVLAANDRLSPQPPSVAHSITLSGAWMGAYHVLSCPHRQGCSRPNWHPPKEIEDSHDDIADTARTIGRPGAQSALVLEPRGDRPLPPPRPRPMGADQPQPDRPDRPDRRREVARGGGRRGLRGGGGTRGQRSGSLSARRELVRPHRHGARSAPGGLFLDGVRPAREPADLLGRPRRAGGRPPQIGQRPRRAADRRRDALPARLFSAEPRSIGLAAG